MVCSLLPVRETAGNQIEAVEKIEEMSVAVARGSRTQLVEFLEITTWILWWARWMLLAAVGCWWLCVTSKQTAVPRTVW